MKKLISLLLSSTTIIICVWLIYSNINRLDIASNKNDHYTAEQKQEINNRRDLDDCEKLIQTNWLELKRENKKSLSKIAFQTQIIALSIIFIQLILIVFILRSKNN